MKNKKYAIDAIRSYEITMDDGWRNDFCESLEECEQNDANRYEAMIDSVMEHLECQRDEAISFYETHRW